MKALTIWRPWTWAICHPSPNAKRVENRTWSAPWVEGKQIAIHAGARYDDEDACEFIADIIGERPPGKAECPQGIVAVATVAMFRRHTSMFGAPDPWLVGPVGWQLRDVIVLAEPIPCKGAQGLWTVPPDVERRIAAAIGAAK